MTLITKTIARIIGGIMLLFGAYLLVNGERSPGGGFAGGVMIASVYILIILAFGRERALKRLNETLAMIMMSIGALMIMSSIFFRGMMGGINPVLIADIGLGSIVIAAVFMIFMELVKVRIRRK